MRKLNRPQQKLTNRLGKGGGRTPLKMLGLQKSSYTQQSRGKTKTEGGGKKTKKKIILTNYQPGREVFKFVKKPLI